MMVISRQPKTPPKDYETQRWPLFPALHPMPVCSSAFLFIWEAIDLAGKSIYPDAWTGAERQVLVWPTSPKRGVEEARAERERTIASLKSEFGQHATTVEQPPRVLAHNSHEIARDIHLKKLAYAEAVAREQEKWEQNQAVMTRLETVGEWLDGCFRNGAVRTYSRFTTLPGEPIAMQPSDWFLEENFLKRMVPGKFHRVFFTTQPPQALEVYAFVNRADLETVIAASRQPKIDGPAPAQVKEASVIGIDQEALSPYLRLAIAVSAQQAISNANPSTTEALAAELIHRAPDFGLAVGSKPSDDISQSFAVEIAKAIRWPSARAGRGKVPSHPA